MHHLHLQLHLQLEASHLPGPVLRSVLTVACEQTEVLLFDPISSKHIKTLTEAHEDCVNNIRWGSFQPSVIEILRRLP